MTRADDGSSGRSRMMRKSHVRFPEKGVGYLLELRPTTTGQFRFGATPYSTIIIGVWGSRQRKIKAAYQFFLYTLLGSVFMLLAILLILLQTGTTDLQISLTTEFSERRQIFLWIASFASFAVKVPMVPVHIWLPEAHVEAPTAGSVILAGIPLKLGTYGFLRFSIPMFPEATLSSTPFIYTPSAIAIIYTSLTTSRQIDLKKIIAYSSVAHMNLVTIVMDTQGQNMCAGRATHQPTSNGGENIACRNKSLIRGVSKRLPSVPKTKSPLAPRDGSGGRPYAQATAAPAPRTTYRFLSDGVYILRRAPKRFLGQLSSLIHRSNALGSSHGGKRKNVVVLLLFAASTHSLLSPASSHTERKSAEPRPDL
ncbi:NADH-ubiquinone oxidoreductase chain, putative [Ricinus communis]|uniref:NADH-ubiquinone oxidoreductase chain 4 n=1 Tax=Ricinus communis TaxID=3988 RepID=B9T8W8_RICCO|nr:NADH-ubiquinone oxidoreductase chain, putative [Ricinus communis]